MTILVRISNAFLATAMVNSIAKVLRNESGNIDMTHRLEYVKSVRSYYTYDGLLEQLALFFQDPLGDSPGSSYLRCARAIPSVSHRRRQ